MSILSTTVRSAAPIRHPSLAEPGGLSVPRATINLRAIVGNCEEDADVLLRTMDRFEQILRTLGGEKALAALPPADVTADPTPDGALPLIAQMQHLNYQRMLRIEMLAGAIDEQVVV